MKKSAGNRKWPAAVKFWLGLAGMSALLILAVPPASADNVVQGFGAQGNLTPGWVVALSKKTKDTVIAAPADDSSQIYGVVVDPSDAPLTLNRGVDNQVFVATTGDYQVLVSTNNGAIKAGDYLSMSSTDGIAAFATSAQKVIIGQALSAFDGKKNVITTVGGYSVGKVLVDISPRKNPLVNNDVAVPGFLRKVAQSVAGRPVSGLRVYIALAFLVSAVTLAMTLLYAGVRGGMIALGRNPLNRGHIMNSMFKVVTAAALVFIIGLFGVYLLLRI